MSHEAWRMQAAADEARSAARHLEQAATEANRAADRMEEVLRRLECLTAPGYGNNVDRFIEAAENIKEVKS